MFSYKYPDYTIENRIVVFHATGAISICNWWASVKQWVSESDSYWYGECDARIEDGAVHWCYYSTFKKFMNYQQILNIKEENNS